MTPTEATKLLEKFLLMADFTDEYGDMCDSEPYEEAVDIAIKGLDFIAENFPETFKDYLNGEQYRE